MFALHSCVTFALQAQLTTHAHPQPHFWPSHPTNTEAGRCGRRRSSDLGLKDAELLEISPVVGEFEYVRTYTLTASVKSDNVSAWVRCSPSRPAVYMYSLASCATRKAHLGHEGSGQLGADGAWTTRGAVAQIPFNSVMDGSNAVNLPSPVLIGTRTGGQLAVGVVGEAVGATDGGAHADGSVGAADGVVQGAVVRSTPRRGTSSQQRTRDLPGVLHVVIDMIALGMVVRARNLHVPCGSRL